MLIGHSYGHASKCCAELRALNMAAMWKRRQVDILRELYGEDNKDYQGELDVLRQLESAANGGIPFYHFSKTRWT